MGTHKDWSFLTKERLEELYQQFGNWADVERHLGIERTALIAVRKRLGMQMGKRADKNRRRWRGSRLDPLKDRIVEMALSGMNCGEIARTIGEEDSEIVRDYLAKIGVQRQRAGAHPGEKNPMWKGGQTVDKHGYILVRAPEGHPFANRHGYVRLHRLVMEQKLGRYLRPEEVVHHIDGNPQNNDPENLELFEDNGYHIRQEWSDPEWVEHQRAIRRGVPSRQRNHQVSESGVQGWW
jgi:hypothetical protein